MVPESKSSNDSSLSGSHIPTSGIHSSIFQQMNRNALFMNSHAVAQATAAFAAAAAAQQVAQQVTNNPNTQQGMAFTPNHLVNQSNNSDNSNNANIQTPPAQQGTQAASQNNTIPSNKLNGNMASLPDAVPVPPVVQNAQTFPNNSQQIAINAQAAALLAAGSMNPALLMNSGSVAPNHATAIAAFATLLQQQQQQQQGSHQQAVPSTSQQYQEQKNPSAGQSTDNMKTASTNPLIQHFNHSTPSQATVLNGRSHQVKKMSNASDSLSSLISYNTATQNHGGKINQNVSSLLHAPNTSATQTTQLQPQSNVNTVYAAAANNSIYLAQMQNWKLEQLGEQK